MVLDKLGLVPFLEVLPAVERAAQAVVVADGHPLGGAVLDEAEVGLRRVRRERAVHFALVQHRSCKHIRAAHTRGERRHRKARADETSKRGRCENESAREERALRVRARPDDEARRPMGCKHRPP